MKVGHRLCISFIGNDQKYGPVWNVQHLRPNGTIPDYYFTEDLIRFLQLELKMKYTHLLELSTAEPRQYRITVLDDTREATLEHMISANTEGFSVVGWYDTPDKLLEVLLPYLQFEASK